MRGEGGEQATAAGHQSSKRAARVMRPGNLKAARMGEAKALRAMADLPLARCCPYQSLAPVLSIMRLVAAASREAA